MNGVNDPYAAMKAAIGKKWIEFCAIGDKDPRDPELAHMRGVFFAGAMAACSVLVDMIRAMDL